MYGFDLSPKLYLSIMHYPAIGCDNLGRLNRKLSEDLTIFKRLSKLTKQTNNQIISHL